MTPDEGHNFSAQPEGQEPQGTATPTPRSTHRPDPVWFPPELLEEIRKRAGENDRSVSS